MTEDFDDGRLLSEEDLEELLTLAEEVAKCEEGVHITNPRKAREVKLVYKLLKYITSGKDVRIDYGLNKPAVSMAYVSVTGREIRFKNPVWFALCSRLASNVEIYPRLDGITQINFAFNKFTEKSEE